MPKITAFVARSFEAVDISKIEPITKFLDSFRDLGFVWETAERAEVESVSKKVRGMIDRDEVFIGILTKRYPVYRVNRSIRLVFDVLLGRLTPVAWVPPSWVLQESGYALKGNKRLILLRETGVEVPGLQGDLEYIDYDPANPASALQRASEMINTLIARTAGFVVETVVRTVESKEIQAPLTQAPLTPAELEEPAPEAPTIDDYFAQMTHAIHEHRWEDAAKVYEIGLNTARTQEPDLTILWQATYHRERFRSGYVKAIDDLKALAESNPDQPTPVASLGRCLFEFQEYEEAAKRFEQAATVSDAEDAVRYRIRAADCLRLAKRLKESRTTLMSLYRQIESHADDLRTGVLLGLHAVLKDSAEMYEAFALAELLLHENPALGDLRFSLGLDYDNSEYAELFLYQYKLICEHEPAKAAALHNLAVAYSKCKLPILSASHYKKAFELGETLSASNLGYTYLNCGMSEEATKLLNEALKKEGCVPDVATCLGAVGKRAEEESNKERSKLDVARNHQVFLLAFGGAFLSAEVPALEGKWKFPDAEIDLELSGGELIGTGQKRVEVLPSFLHIALGGSKEPSEKVEKFRFSGSVTGRSCKFEIESETLPTGIAAAAFAGLYASTVKGYLVFAVDGRSGDVVELKDGRPEKYYSISKVGN